MKKRITALFVLIIMCFTFLAETFYVYGNIQIPVENVSVDEVYYILGQNVVTGQPILRPTMTVSWQNPSSWDTASDPANVHEPDYYEVEVYNRTLGTTETIKVNKGTDEYNNRTLNVHEKVLLDTGCLYQVSVQPYHYHTVVIDGEPTYVLAPTVGGTEKAFAVTDLHVDLVPDDTSISVVWDNVNIDDMEYRIVYAIGDYSNKTKQELIDNKEGEITNLSSTDPNVEEFYDPVTKRKKLKYTLTQNVYPGQIYSIMVEPLQEYFEGDAIIRNRNYPYIFTCSTNINLEVFEDGQYVRLEWDIPANFKIGQAQDEYELVEARLVEYIDGQGRNIVVFDDKAANMEYYKVPKPSKEVEYQLLLRYEAVGDSNKIPIEPHSEKVPYVPIDLQIKPTKPYVPQVITDKIVDDLKNNHTVDEIKTILQEKYLVEGHSYNGNINALLDEKITFHIDDSQENINFVWGSFKRKDIDSTSPTFGETITDTNVYYDIYVTKDLESLTSALKVVDNQKYSDTTPQHIITNDEGDILGFKHTLEYYYDPDYSELQRIVPNQLYYIRVVAKKVWGQQESISEPTDVSIYYGYGGDAYEPPSIVKPPLKVKEDEVTTTAVGVTWKESWWEVIAKDTTKYGALSSWAHQVWVKSDGTISTSPLDGAEYFSIYNNELEVDRLIQYVQNISGFDDFDVYKRKVDLGQDSFGVSDVKYKFYKIPYSEVQKKIDAQGDTYTFADYYDELIKNDKNGTDPLGWIDIETQYDPDNAGYLYYVEQGLLPNTLYLFLVYPYREMHTGELVMAHYPAPIVVATEPESGTINPDPTVPNLYVSDYTDTTITVTWKYNTDFTYEIKYSEQENIDTAEDYTIQLPGNPLDPNYPTDGAYYEVTIDDLFPNSDYYFWIRAKNPETNKISSWSNVAIGNTRDVSSPLPPKGIGIASMLSMKAHGYDKNVDSDFISVEWLLDIDDVPNKENSKVKKNYSYIMEVSDNPLFIDPQYIVSSGGEADVKPDNVELLKKNVVKVNQLLANRHYYVRMKTRVTVVGSKEGQLIVKDSLTYSEPIKITTTTTSGEYDSDQNPNLDILPSDNYEISYDPVKKELEFRFRGDEDEDYSTDQRLISELIQKNEFEYNVDISNFEGKPITKRTVTVPYSIISAFDDYKVDLSINTGDMKIVIPYGALKSQVSQEVYMYGSRPSVQIKVEQLDGYYHKEQMPSDAYLSASVPQEVNILVNSDNGNKKISYTDKALAIKLKTTSRYGLYGKETVSYQKNTKNKWSEVDGEYNAYDGYMTINTGTLGVYGVYIINETANVPTPSQPAHWAEPFMKNVFKEYSITGLDSNINLDGLVTETQTSNIVLSLIYDEKEIDVNSYISSEQKRQMVIAKVILDDTITNEPISRDQAISMFVRAYEILNGDVQVQSQVANSILGSSEISDGYRTNLAKAYEIGLLADANSIRPQDKLKYGELFSIWDRLNE